jgi:ethanolamine transporter EutH
MVVVYVIGVAVLVYAAYVVGSHIGYAKGYRDGGDWVMNQVKETWRK